MSDPGNARSVAVVMRTKDRPVLLERAVRSVVSQTFSDFELIVVNDGGDPEAVDELIRRHPAPEPARVRTVHHAKPAGLLSPPNAPIRDSASVFVAIHDDDDSWHPEFLEQTTCRLQETGAMGVIATTDKVVEALDGDRIDTVERSRLHPGLRFLSLYEMCFENYATPIAFLYRREAYDAIGGYDESLETVADWDFAIRFLSRYEIEFLETPDALAFYHHRPEAVGVGTNSVYTDRHRRAENLIANRYLRDDISSGRPGLGLVMNALRHDYAAGESLFERHRVSGDERNEYLAECIRKLDARVSDLQTAISPSERLKSDLRFARSLPRLFARRLGR
jgi:glycosyltransferase involved in cell wall biosynthesis